MFVKALSLELVWQAGMGRGLLSMKGFLSDRAVPLDGIWHLVERSMARETCSQ